jgi:enoyl-CoA hydratase
VLRIAQRIATIPSDILQINKRTVHRAMEVQGIRTATRSVTELNGLAMNLESTKALRGNAAAAIKDAAKR